jgi:hypothetical protein
MYVLHKVIAPGNKASDRPAGATERSPECLQVGDRNSSCDHTAEFDRQYMVKLFEYERTKAQAGYPWRGAPPGF